MSAVHWREGEVYRCVNSKCECELVIKQLPRLNKHPMSLPSCCACGAPMQLRKAPEELPG